ncbi:MAG TPA: hypothetical protein VKY74_08655 [Chloroflexia bacterium]|nr:hypothetical protein [Chloroflexia bacterium]
MDGTANSSRAAELVVAHLESLVARTLPAACSQVPWYRSLPAAVLQEMFRHDYEALAAMLASNDMAALRAYVEQTGIERIGKGASAPALIAAAALLENEVSQLIAVEMAPDHASAIAATRRVQLITKNVRMILSGINLRLLTQPAAPPPR